MYSPFTVKDNVSVNDLLVVHPNLIYVLGYLCRFAHQNSLPLVITSITDEAANRVSKSHDDGRALDVSIKNWTDQDIDECKEFLEFHCGALGAVSKKDLRRRLIVDHTVDGSTRHLHIQVAP